MVLNIPFDWLVQVNP